MTKSQKWIKGLNAHFPWILMMFLITIESAISGALLQIEMIAGLDKLIHFMIFGLLGWLLSRGAWKSNNPFLIRNFVWIVPFIAACFAVSDEIHQALIPGRFPDPFDWLADICGVILFMILFKKKNFRVQAKV